MPRLLGPRHRLALHLGAVDQALHLLGLEHRARLRHRHAPPLALREDAAEGVPEVDPHGLHALPAEQVDGGHAGLGDLQLDLAVLELPLAQHAAQRPPRLLAVGAGLAGQQQVEEAVLGGPLGAHLDLLRSARSAPADGGLHEVADDRVDVAPDVADLGELGGLDLDERGARPGGPGGGRSRSCRPRWGRS